MKLDILFLECRKIYGYNLSFFSARKTREFIWEPLSTIRKMRVKIKSVTFDPFLEP